MKIPRHFYHSDIMICFHFITIIFCNQVEKVKYMLYNINQHFYRRGNMKKGNYNHTLAACCLAYLSQSVASTFLPLLFVRFGSEFGLSIESLTVLITVTFFTQIFVDAAAPFIVRKTGYRALTVTAAVFSFCGFAGLSFMADIMPNPFFGFLICTVLYAIGSGLIEVLITPIVESCPTQKKAGMMAFVHSSYCAGCVAVVLLSTLFFKTAGIENWRILALLFPPCRSPAAYASVLCPYARRRRKESAETCAIWSGTRCSGSSVSL